MAGFLDRDTRVVDMVLTGLGKSLLSQGNLQFVYWSPFDDEVDYSPPTMNSGSLTSVQLSASVDARVQSMPVREACSGYRLVDPLCSDTTNVLRPVFTMAPGQTHVPKAVFSDLSDSNVRVGQRAVKRDSGQVGQTVGTLDVSLGVEFIPTSNVQLDMSYEKDGFPPGFRLQGFKVEVFSSGSGGLVEQVPRRDLDNNVAMGADLRISVLNGQRDIVDLFTNRDHLTVSKRT